ncbi:MAG: SusC/RagA family TonB-linked outer membrane protein [Prevotella sp.]|nr:SusC/RagA family TonB-linked outer membrane protein [Prevotella sp.]
MRHYREYIIPTLRRSMAALAALVCLMLLGTQTALAQQHRLTGTVTDETGEPLTGVTVTIVGHQNAGAITDLNGHYSLSVPDENAALRFTYVGYKAKAVNLKNGQQTLNVVLAEDTKMLSETVVTAMDIRRDEKSMSTAYQKVDIAGMDENRSTNFLDMLSGKIAGVQIISNGVGGSASVVIRGMNSITGNNQPLFVIDGTPIINDVQTGEIGLDYGNPAANLNPDDIEDIVVLKGANASALYGSDAANGAILITTKKAGNKTAGLGVSYSSTLQFSHIMQKPSYQNVYGGGESGLGIKKETFNYLENSENPYDPNYEYGIARLGWQNQRSWGFPMLDYRVLGRNGEYKTYSADNSLLDLYETAHSWTNNVSIEKASEVASFRLSYTNVNSDDVMQKQNEFKRNNFNFHGTVKPVKWFEVELNARYSTEHMDNRNWRNANKQNPMYNAAWMPRDMAYGEMTPWKEADGTLAGFNKGGFVNPLWSINEMSNEDTRDTFWGNITLKFDLYKGLTLRLKGNMDKSNVEGNEFVNMYDPKDISQGDGKYKEFQESARNVTYEALLSYNKRWNDFNLSASVGANTSNFKFKKINSEVQTLLMPDVKSLANNGAKMNSWQDYSAKRKQAVFGTASPRSAAPSPAWVTIPASTVCATVCHTVASSARP